jgi:glycosyltransferase involved in cell wall biosynthesis
MKPEIAKIDSRGGGELVDPLRASSTWQRAYSEPEPLVTVRIATWNRAELLVERALASAYRQTYTRWEAVIVGDACTDDTEERLAALGDPRIRFHNLPVHGPYPEDPIQRWMIAGVPAMNEGLRRAKGSWIAPLDDDDEWEDDHLEVLLGAAREGGAEFVYGRARCTVDGQSIGKEVGAWPPRYGEIDLTASLYNAALREFRHDMMARHLGEGNDWNLVRRMLEAGVRFEFVDRIVSTYAMDHLRDVVRGQRGEQRPVQG